MKNEINQIEILTRIVTEASDTYELCRALVHSDFLGEEKNGAQLISVDQRGLLKNVASYGRIPPLEEGASLWDEGVVPNAIRKNELLCTTLEQQNLTIIPLFTTALPVGGLIIATVRPVALGILGDSELSILARWGAFFLRVNGFAHGKETSKTEEDPESLTNRQLEVLSRMAAGYTNAEIARELLLSESTIRQETVKIYRALGVNSRIEASKKGKALGLVPRLKAV